MSYISGQPEQSTSDEIDFLTALSNLSISGPGFAIAKTLLGFENVQVGGSESDPIWIVDKPYYSTTIQNNSYYAPIGEPLSWSQATAQTDLTGDKTGSFNLTTTGLGTLGSLLVDSPTLAVNVAGYTDKIGFGTATPANTWEFSDGTPTPTFAGIGMLLRNPTDADGTTTLRVTPALIQSAQGKGATNQQYQWAGVMIPSSNADNLTYRYYYKFGAGAWTVHPYYLDTSSGFIIAGLANGEDIWKAPNTFNLLNTTAATSTVDQYSPPISWASQGWKTASTAGTQYMGLIQVNAPELGVISPIGVHKWMYGINTFGNSISEANELMRLQWGSDAGVTGVFFNQKNLADYVVAINNDSTYLKFGTGQDAGITYDGTNMLLNPKLVGTGYLNIQGQTLLDDKLLFTQTDGNEYIDSLNDGYLDLYATTQIRFNSKMTIDGSGRVALYNNIATEGYGVPAIIDSINLTEQTAAISDTTFSNASATGLYRVNFYIFTAVADVAQTVTLKLKWNDGVVARSVSVAAINTGTTDYNQGVYYVYLEAGSVQYETTISGSLEDGSYELHISVERLN
jgi:hypothetical protein